MSVEKKDIKTPYGCSCEICINNDQQRWQTIEDCKCHCHNVPHPVGHDGLCCAYPNGKKADNPYKSEV